MQPYLTLRLLNLSAPQFSHLSNGPHRSIFFIGLFWGFKESRHMQPPPPPPSSSITIIVCCCDNTIECWGHGPWDKTSLWSPKDLPIPVACIWVHLSNAANIILLQDKGQISCRHLPSLIHRQDLGGVSGQHPAWLRATPGPALLTSSVPGAPAFIAPPPFFFSFLSPWGLVGTSPGYPVV